MQPTISASARGDRLISRSYTPKTEIAYDADGRTIATVDPNGNLVNAAYDAAGELTQQTSGTRNTTRFGYDALGNPISKTDALGNVTVYSYDLLGELISEKDPAKSAILYGYDELGDRTTDSAAIAAYVYDAYGHVLKQTSPRSFAASGVGSQRVTSYSYDALGRKIGQVDGNGMSQSWTYNYYGQLASQTGLGSSSAPAPITGYLYDTAGEKIMDIVTAPLSGGSYAGQINERAYAYDSGGRLQSVTDASGTAGALSQYGQATYAYDAGGRLTHQLFIATLLGYGTTCPPTTTQDTVSQYDSDGHLWNIYDSKGELGYYYDAAGNRKLTVSVAPDNGATPIHAYQYDYNADNKVINVVDAEARTASLTNVKASQFQYDAAGNRIAELDFTSATLTPVGGTATDLFDQAESGTGTLTTYAYDADNRLASTASGTATTYITYDRGSDRQSAYSSFSNGLTPPYNNAYYYYNPDGSQRQVSAYSTSGGSSTQTYTDDNAGNVATLVVAGSQTTTYTYSYQGGTFGNYLQTRIVASNSSGSTTSTQTWDVRDQLTSTSSNGNVVTNNDGLIVNSGSSASQPGSLYIYQGDQLLGDWQFPASGSGAMTADFGYNFTPIGSNYPAVAPGSTVVNSGDTLKSIAQQIYGDSSLWYVIADANGIQGNGGAAGTTGSGFVVGQVLTLPNQVINSNNTATTFRPYNASQIIGNQNPPAPVPPPAHHHCNVLATIVIAVVLLPKRVADKVLPTRTPRRSTNRWLKTSAMWRWPPAR